MFGKPHRPVDLSALVPQIRERVDVYGHRYDLRPELVGDLLEATEAAHAQRRIALAGTLANARRALMRDELTRAAEYMLTASTMVRLLDPAA